MIVTPATNSGSGLPVVEPLTGGVDGTPLSVSGGAATTTNSVVSDAVYIYSNTPVHVRVSDAGTAATTNDFPIPANVPIVFRCAGSNKVSVIKMTGAADGSCWVHELMSM